MLTLGIDIGSTTSKCVLMEDGQRIVTHVLVKSGIGTDGAKKAFEQTLEQSKIKYEDIAFIMATGYGRNNFELAKSQMSELSCHAKGIHYLYPDVHTIIDIGGQDAKVISLDKNGIMTNFLMNDKCAAGTGRFLDVMSNILDVDVAQLEKKARASNRACRISSTCTVFAESEVISQLANGEKIEDVIAGICNSVASRVAALAKRLSICENVFMSGGVALNGGVRDALEKELGVKIYYSENSQIMGAIGAAIFAFEKARANNKK